MITTLTLEECDKLWIYQANRPLTPADLDVLHKRLAAFVDGWSSHGKKLQGAYEIRHNRFILIGVNEAQASASGCSIDSSVSIIKELERELTISLLDKTKIAFDINGAIETVPFSKLKENVQAGKIHSKSLLFDNSINTGSALKNNWKIPASHSWMSRYFQ